MSETCLSDVDQTKRCTTDLGGRDDGEGAHHSVRVLFTDLRDQECTHTGTGTTTEGVGDLETLETVGVLSLPSDHIEDRVDELGTWYQREILRNSDESTHPQCSDP